MLKIKFCDFWPGFDRSDNLFINYFRELTEVELSDKPDILFFSVFGYKHLNYNCKKVFFTGENVRPDFRFCDYALSFDYDDNSRNYRLPLYALCDDPKKLLQSKNPQEILREKTKFCNFIYSNPVNKVRNDFYKKLSKYKKIDSGGRVFNNMKVGNGKFRIPDKREFIKDYKFTIAIENGFYNGYTREKIFEPMLENSLPIYMGNEFIGKDFNTNSFLNFHDYDSIEQFIDKIIEVDNNDELYMSYFKEPYFKNNEINEYIRKENVLKFFSKIKNDDVKLITDKYSGLHRTIIDNNKKISYYYNFLKTKVQRFSIEKFKFI